MDGQGRETLFCGSVRNRTLKCVVGFNYRSKKNSAMRKGLVQNACSRCGSEED